MDDRHSATPARQRARSNESDQWALSIHDHVGCMESGVKWPDFQGPLLLVIFVNDIEIDRWENEGKWRLKGNPIVQGKWKPFIGKIRKLSGNKLPTTAYFFRYALDKKRRKHIDHNTMISTDWLTPKYMEILYTLILIYSISHTMSILFGMQHKMHSFSPTWPVDIDWSTDI